MANGDALLSVRSWECNSSLMTFSSSVLLGKTHLDALPFDEQLLGPLTPQPHLRIVGSLGPPELHSAGVAKVTLCHQSGSGNSSPLW